MRKLRRTHQGPSHRTMVTYHRFGPLSLSSGYPPCKCRSTTERVIDSGALLWNACIGKDTHGGAAMAASLGCLRQRIIERGRENEVRLGFLIFSGFILVSGNLCDLDHRIRLDDCQKGRGHQCGQWVELRPRPRLQLRHTQPLNKPLGRQKWVARPIQLFSFLENRKFFFYFTYSLNKKEKVQKINNKIRNFIFRCIVQNFYAIFCLIMKPKWTSFCLIAQKCRNLWYFKCSTNVEYFLYYIQNRKLFFYFIQ